jgi:hypothetical protein
MPGEIQTVCYGNGTVVAGSRENDGQIAWSDDGVTWTGLDGAATTFGTNFVHVRFLNGKFWAVGGGGHMANSTDGKTWAAVANPGITLNIVDIAWGGVAGKPQGVFVAVGDDGTMSYSEDNGVTWRTNNQDAYFTDANGAADFKTICWSGDKFLAAGQFARAIYSADGKTWTDISVKTGYVVTGKQGIIPCVGKSGHSGLSVTAYGAGVYIAGGQGILGVSTDLENWERIDMEPFGFTEGHRSGWINGLIYADGIFVLGGADGKSAYSFDGRNWTPVEDTNRIFHNFHFINGITYGGGKFVAVGATCSKADCPNNPKSDSESDHEGNVGCVAYAALR